MTSAPNGSKWLVGGLWHWSFPHSWPRFVFFAVEPGGENFSTAGEPICAMQSAKGGEINLQAG